MKTARRKGLYKKARPGDPSRWDWYSQVKVGGAWVKLSLCLQAVVGGKECNVREAESRRDALRVEVSAGKLSTVLDWMAPEQAARIKLKMAVGRLRPTDDKPASWDEARNAWLHTYRVKRVDEVEGKINVTHAADDKRVRYIDEFLKFVAAKGAAIQGADIDDLYIQFFKSLDGKRNGNTIDVHFSYIVKFGDYLAGKGLCLVPNRVEIRKTFPPIKPVVPNVPHWAEDLAVMKALYEHRHDSSLMWSAWGLFLIVRGMGCRPDEVLHLSWTTVNMEKDSIMFMDTKENRKKKRQARHVPILFDWVHAGLLELLDDHRHRKPDTTAVCLTRANSHFKTQNTACDSFAKALDRLALPESYRLKVAQKSHIDQLRSMGLPDAQIAEMTGHSMPTYVKQYIKGNTYDRFDCNDYGEYGTLSENGRFWCKKWGAQLG